ncbi:MULTISPECIES: hypothetical protein [Megasphaera]|uniref:DNA-binding protein n=1 Tax=Megasphaera vaginalis (ex Srinivasan et al. 2021) TaxID=1111454 RepID=U7UJS1_9FIRM|nr:MULTISPECIES: hypothetical protein [Megasphaera]ERT59652.1 hypothetical protein HMPREF1250_0785 [Megasphaera vaginalis (ex Srinivasan et al. 2021)]
MKISIAEAAKRMGKSMPFVRIGLQRGLLPFGEAFKTDEKNTRYNYHINAAKFEKYMRGEL